MEETTAPADPLPSADWTLLPWRTLEQYVDRQQKRLYKAASRDNVRAVRRLQQVVMQSHAARLLAVRRGTQDKQGKEDCGGRWRSVCCTPRAPFTDRADSSDALA
jgi:hypothetical protein